MVDLLSDMGPEGVAETVWRRLGDAQTMPKSADEPPQSGPKEPEAAEDGEKETEAQKQRNVKIWFS